MRLARLSAAWLTALFAVLTLGPLLALAYLAVERSGNAVQREAEARVSSTATVAADLVHAELSGLTDVVDAYAKRLSLRDALGAPASPKRARELRLHLRQLRAQREGIAVTFVTDPSGRLLDVLPETPSIVGRDFSDRDWYRGVTRTGRPYVSEAYRSAASGAPLVVAAAAPVRAGPDRRVAILVAAFRLEYVQALVDELERDEGVTLTVTDQRGTVVAAAASPGSDGVYAASASVPGLGWAVTASVDRDVAFAGARQVRDAVLSVAAVLALVLVAGLALLAYTLRGREEAERREEAALRTAERRNAELEDARDELEAQYIELEAQADALARTQDLLEQALGEARRLAEVNGAVLDATVDPILMVGTDGRIVLVNRAMRRFGESVPHFRGQESFWAAAELFTPLVRDPDAYRAALERLQRDPEREGVDELELVEQGVFLQRYTAPVRDADGAVVGRIFVLRDVTAEREADRAKSELLATVSHELRTPLTGVLGFAELLVEHKLDDETQRQYLRTIVGEAQRLRVLLNDFLDLQRIEERGLTLSLGPVALDELVAEQAALHVGTSARHTARLSLDAGLEVLGERDRIVQVLGNLLSNAVKYSPAGGTVTVSGRRVGGSARIEVRDEGLGIPLVQQAQVFQRFFRVDSSDTRNIGGTGLGLALVREIVEAHGGTVGFESIPGAGSTFWFELPRVAPVETPERRRLALVVEDHHGTAALLHHHLGELGYDVELTASGADALERVERRRPDVVVLDIGLAGRLDGWEVLTRLRTSPAAGAAHVLVCSGSDQRERALAHGADGFLRKPFDPDELEPLLPGPRAPVRGSVIVVEDDERVRSLVAAALEREHVQLHEAGDAAGARRLLAQQHPDAIVLDLGLPDLDGLDLLRSLRKEAGMETIPVIVLTGRPADETELAELGAALLPKSAYSASELRRLVRAALAA